MQSRRKPEVMSPAGYWPQLNAAIEAGADSVYFGLHHFTARAKVGFDIAELPGVMRTLHQRGVRGFVTFNTLVFEHELAAAAKTIASIAQAGVDAMIVQDYGIVRMAREIVPDMELHASTQMSITNVEGVRLAQSFGIQRVTLARELSLDEIRRIIAGTDCELEMFVHGALCVAYSGQCFSSEAWGGRSANRGQCAQACRLPYELIVDGELKPLADARYLLSPGDLYALKQIPEIVDIGVAALKIEGRYKDADYVALATSAYRKAVDDAWAGRTESPSRASELQLEQVYSRGLGPFFIEGTNHQKVVSGRAPRHRGVLMGRVTALNASGITIDPADAQSVAPMKAGDGVVFDAADWRSPQEPEEGGRVYSVSPQLDGRIELRFGRDAINTRRIRPGDLVWRSHDPNVDRAARPFLEPAAPVAKQRLDVRVTARAGERLVIEWRLEKHPSIAVVVHSPAPLDRATLRGITEEYLRDQLGRMGNTPYQLARLDADVGGDPFAPASLLNQLRREAVTKLQELQGSIRPVKPCPLPSDAAPADSVAGDPELHLLVRSPEQLEAALSLGPSSITLDYLDLYGLRPSVDRARESGVTVRVASPRVLKPGESRITQFLSSLNCPILVRGAGMIEPLRQAGVDLIGDFSLNTANAATARIYLELGIQRLTPTHDLNAAQIASLGGAIGAHHLEVIAYQHLPVFHTEHCVFCRFMSTGTTYKDCGRPCEEHRIALKDPQGRQHPVMADVGCRNTVFGAEAQEASAHLELWRNTHIRHFRLEFVHESADQVRRVTRTFQSALKGTITFAELGAELRRIAPQGTTEGSLFVPKDYLVLPVLQ